ncbi:pre-mRNA-splicing factor CWC25 homolog [Oryza brachyantha]|uniref:CBF1-interacting co-repressor CIR N-terminal domain-containing protein n=1 Tax=Oryza brachyantha TaxID=4533 RepID=J3MU63_ORYBR|nr:pre-mRNA-splicing factor CWC25 homolog [Oryza brachyantha]
MGMKFLNKKGWHTGSLRNIERVWVAEEKEKEEQRKIQELKKQQDEEREKAAFRKLQEDAGLRPRQERLDFLYESGLAVGKGSSEGFQALQPSAPAAAAASSSAQASAGSSKAATPGALFEDKPQSANDAWRKLHSDPLLLIRQREQDAIARIKNNPIKMAEIKKSVEAEKKQKEEKKEKRKHKKHRHHKSKSKKHYSSDNSDSEESDGKDEKRKSVHSSEHKREEKMSRPDKDHRQDSEDDEPRKRRHVMSEDDKPRKSRNEKKGQREDSEDDKPRKSRRDGHRHDSEDEEPRRKHKTSDDEVPRRKHKTSEDDEPKRRQSEVSGDNEARRRRQEMPKHVEYSRQDHSGAGDRRGRHYAPSDRNNAYLKHDSSDSRHRRPEYGRSNSTSELDSEGQRRQESQQGRNGPTFNRRRGVHHMSEEEREARLRQMQADAEVHEEQRWSRLKKAADDDAKEAASVNANQFRGKNFLEEEKKSIFGTEKGGSATIEESIRRRAYYSQRNAHESNAFRR